MKDKINIFEELELNINKDKTISFNNNVRCGIK